MSLSQEDGRAVVELARSAIEAHVRGEKLRLQSWSSGFLSQERGVFVTLNTVGQGPDKLRGCIGFPYPVKKLGEAVQEAAIASASEDPRFPPVRPGELGSIVVEVSVLTPPKPLEAKRRADLQKMVRIGKDGLIVSRSYTSGLLLPQVATEFGFDQQEFLCQACLKAGLMPDAWLDQETKLHVFQAEVFAEKSPRGDVVREES
jgi:hypothetical protein